MADPELDRRSLRRTGMRRLIVSLAATATLMLVGCGSEDAVPTSSESEPDKQPETEPAVQSVTLTRTGGVAGVHETWRIGPADPGHRAVFEAANPRALAGAEGSGGTPPCCDFFQHQLIVQYADGSTASFRLYDGASTDPALERLVDAVLMTDPERPVTEPRT